jgi:hypothetical protein
MAPKLIGTRLVALTLIPVVAIVAACVPGGAPSPSPATATASASSSPGAAFATCESLNSLPSAKTITNGAPPVNSFQPPLMDIAAHPFTWASGVTTSAGHATTGTAGRAAGSGMEIGVNNILLSISVGFGQSLKAVRIAFGEYGGNLNLSVNNTMKNVDNFSTVNGTGVGGVAITVTSGGSGNDSGVVEFTGLMPDQVGGLGQLAIGGQELWIDDICFDK